MDITLVTSTFNDDVHGTDNDKKTGCGISLIKPENVTRFRRGSTMTDLKEITCEKCKSVLAKKIIRSDKKEMSRIIKEEKMKAKRGIEDDTIVPLGNTTAKITGQSRQQTNAMLNKSAPRPAVQPAAAPQPAPQPAPAPAELPRTIAGTGVELDSSLAQFAVNAPQPEPAPAEAPAQNDFLAQFAIHKPEEDITEPETAPAHSSPVPQDDFLAQFAVNAPQSELPPPKPIWESRTPDPVPEPVPAAAPQPEYTAPVETAVPEPEPETDLTSVSEWDLVANQIFGFEGVPQTQPEAPAEMDELPTIEGTISAPEPVPAPAAPIIDDIPAPVQNAVPEPIPAPAAPIIDDIPAPVQEASSIAPAQPAEPAAPIFDSIEDAGEEISALLNKFAQPKAPVQEAIPAPEPVQMTAPVPEPIPEPVSTVSPEPVQPAAPTPVQAAAPVQDDFLSQFAVEKPAESELPPPKPIWEPHYSEPVPEPAVEAVPEPIEEEPVPEEMTAPEPVRYTTPFDEPIRPAAPSPMPAVPPMPAAPSIPDIPTPTPNESVANMHNYSSGDITTPPTPSQNIEQPQVQPTPAPAAAAMPSAPVQPPQSAPIQPQIVNVPQFSGYDQNGQPIYQYVQMQMTGFDPNGQPILAPLPGQAPAPQAVPVQPAPQAMPQQAQAPYTVPTANISKIAVNEHTRPTSRAFVQAISNSKSYANKSLLETQGLQMNAPMLASIEDVISQIDTGSAARARQAAPAQSQQPQTQKPSPVYNEYKAGSQPARRTPASAMPSRQQKTEEDIRFMTKSEIKEMKKQEKIDAKFKKNMAKRGL